MKIQHSKYKDIYKVFIFDNNNELKKFIENIYSIKNFKIDIDFILNNINIADMIDIYNLNPYLNNIKIEDIGEVNSKEFFKKYNINNYKIEDYIYTDFASVDEAYYIYVKNELNIYETYLFPTFDLFYNNLKKMILSKIEHSYLVEPSVISVENYLKTLNLYGKFNNKKFKNSFEINQYIKDIRCLSEIKKPEQIKNNELT